VLEKLEYVETARVAVGSGWIRVKHIGPRPYGVSGWGGFFKCGSTHYRF